MTLDAARSYADIFGGEVVYVRYDDPLAPKEPK